MTTPTRSPLVPARLPASPRRPGEGRRLLALLGGMAALGLTCHVTAAAPQRPQEPGGPPGGPQMKQGGAFSRKDYGEKELKEPFKGVTIDGQMIRGLFPIRSTGVATGPVRAAAEAFLAALTNEQRARVSFAVDAAEWRKWSNVSWYVRQGVALNQMTAPQRQAALDLMRASLSAKGFKTAQDIMRLNHTLGELLGDRRQPGDEFDEDIDAFTVMGKPSASDPWGWQVDGHDLIVNDFVLGDQVVMTPPFMGSEPVRATAGKYAGTAVLQGEQDEGLALINALDAPQQQAILSATKGGLENVAEAFKDNVVLANAGIKATELTAAQREQLVDLIGEYVRNRDDGHARIAMDDVRQHLDETYFAGIGKFDPQAVFYDRVQSSAILIEFDHQALGPLGAVTQGGADQPPAGGPPMGRTGGRSPSRQHIHTVVRTPNGNDYGKDLLRQHHEQHPHDHRGRPVALAARLGSLRSRCGRA